MSRKFSAVKTVSDTTKYTLYTVPTKHFAEWELAYVISLTSTETPKVYWYDSSANIEYLIIGGKNLGAGDYIILNNADVIIEENDEIRIQNAGTNSVTYLITVQTIPQLSDIKHN